MKICTKCKLKKSDACFYSRGDYKNKLRSHCKNCVRARDKASYKANKTERRARGKKYDSAPERKRAVRRSWLKQLYGLTETDYVVMLAQQNNRCKLCERVLEAGRNTHVDHDHDTGKVRGLLCSCCNRNLGRFKDSPALLRKAAEYIENAKI